MVYDANAVANAFLKLAKSERTSLTNMQLQKLVYIAHGFTVAMLGKPLFSDKVYAWKFGPVIPALYQELKKYGSGKVTDRLFTKTPPVEPEGLAWKVIRGVWNSYGKFSGPELSAMTHQEGSPWHLVWEPGTRKEIPLPVIRKYYVSLLKLNGPRRSHQEPTVSG